MRVENEIKNRDFSIELVRVVAMFMIIFDHMLDILSFPFQSAVLQLLNSGVFIFIFISGYLFGKKTVTDWKRWFKRRILRIMLPLWIYGAIDILTGYFLWDKFDPDTIWIFAFNLQGFPSMVRTFGSHQLWFVTFIMICYILTPIWQWIKRVKVKEIGYFYLFLIILQVFTAYITDLGLFGMHYISWCIFAIMVYGTGYLFGGEIINRIKIFKEVIKVTGVMAICVLSAVMLRSLLDGSILYDRILVLYCIVGVDLSIVSLFYYFGTRIHNNTIVKRIQQFDKVSYEFYLVHGLVLSAITEKILYEYGVCAYLVTTIVISYILASLIHLICQWIIRKV